MAARRELEVVGGAKVLHNPINAFTIKHVRFRRPLVQGPSGIRGKAQGADLDERRLALAAFIARPVQIPAPAVARFLEPSVLTGHARAHEWRFVSRFTFHSCIPAKTWQVSLA